MLCVNCDNLAAAAVETVGNLVCPAEFGVGEHAEMIVHATSEAEEEPLKYPVMFSAVDAVVLEVYKIPSGGRASSRASVPPAASSDS